MENGLYDFNWTHRWPACDLACKSARGVQIHQRKVHKEENSQNFDVTLADKAVQTFKIKAQQNTSPVFFCEDILLENVFSFKYLGNLFTATDLHSYDINARIAQVWTTTKHF